MGPCCFGFSQTHSNGKERLACSFASFAGGLQKVFVAGFGGPDAAGSLLNRVCAREVRLHHLFFSGPEPDRVMGTLQPCETLFCMV